MKNTEVNILKNEVECDQIFIKESFKGNHKKDNFNMPRESILKKDINMF